MHRPSILKAVQFSAIAGLSYYVGNLAGRKSSYEPGGAADPGILAGDNFQVYTKPPMPIFSTVFAATAVPAPSAPQSERRVSRISEIMKYGYPGMDQLLTYTEYVISYDRRNRVPHWVFEHITPHSVKHNDAIDRSKCNFSADPHIHEFFRSDNTDYKRSGYDRGHLAAAGNHRKDQKHCEETFYLSNIAPQVGEGFNRDAWNRLERYVRQLTKSYPNVYICTGPLYLPRKESDGKMYVKYEVIGSNTVAVPTHFFKVVVGETADKKLVMESYVMPNQKIDDKTPLEVFQVRPETIERSAGLLFFTNIQRKQFAMINGKKV